MEMDTLLSAVRDFEKKGKKETCPILDQFLCHIAKTGETMVQWSQFKSYFLFKLEKVMDDFKSSCPEQRGAANPNVENVPFEEMKERILKIVDGYNGIPFTIQRLCELLTEPKRNYTGTDKFLRGVEKNVMVVSCVYPTSEKNGSSCVSRMNGVMFPGNPSALADRNVNGPRAPRPLNRPKLSLSSSAAPNRTPDSTENKEGEIPTDERTGSDGLTAESNSGPTKHKLREEEEDEEEEEEAAPHNAKRLKFDKDDEEEEEENKEEVKETTCPALAESSSDVLKSSVQLDTEMKDTTSHTAEDQEPSSTQSDPADDPGNQSGTEGSPDRPRSPEVGAESDSSEQHVLQEKDQSTEVQEDKEKHEPVSSTSTSTSTSSGQEGTSSTAPSSSSSPSSSTEPPAEGSSSAENNSDSLETADDNMVHH